MKDDKLWKAFSIYIRLRDSDENGFCFCFTCGRPLHWRKMDCGHGLGRQHKAIKYHEWNNHAQCGNCNLDGGRQDLYKSKVNFLYGESAWSILELKARGVYRMSQFEIDALQKHYTEEYKKLLKQKSLSL